MKKFLYFFGLIFSLAFFFVLVFCVFKTNLPKEADAILVLGASIKNEKTVLRAKEAADVYKKTHPKVVVFSGGVGDGNKVSEASFMSGIFLEELGEENISGLFLEEGSHNTYENFLLSKQYINPKSKVIFITHDYHLGRSFLTAKMHGYEEVYWQGVSSEGLSLKVRILDFLREILAIFSYFPRFLGILNTAS